MIRYHHCSTASWRASRLHRGGELPRVTAQQGVGKPRATRRRADVRFPTRRIRHSHAARLLFLLTSFAHTHLCCQDIDRAVDPLLLRQWISLRRRGAKRAQSRTPSAIEHPQAAHTHRHRSPAGPSLPRSLLLPAHRQMMKPVRRISSSGVKMPAVARRHRRPSEQRMSARKIATCLLPCRSTMSRR